ncbi:hypothetical protein [Anaplasma phagocytophilum]|uniref:hypothetical protein n=1 Tax=Anaplasma phagocytophilum TaxID=948 RepID=UPI00201AAE4B
MVKKVLGEGEDIYTKNNVLVESLDEEEESPLIAGVEQLRKDKEKESESTGEPYVPDSVFLVASFLMMVTETFSTFFTMAVIRYAIKPSIVHRVTLAYFAMYALLAMVLLLDSYAALSKHRKDLEKGKISGKEYNIGYWKETTTIASSVFCILLCVLSLVMEVGVESKAIQMVALVVSILAPLLGAISASIRAYEVMRYQKQKQKIEFEGGDKEASNTGVCVKSLVFLTIALFEFCHCICHLYEAYLLVGQTNKLFYITDMALLTTQAALAIAFAIFYFYEKVVGEEKDGPFVGQQGNVRPDDKGEGARGLNGNVVAEDIGGAEKGCCADGTTNGYAGLFLEHTDDGEPSTVLQRTQGNTWFVMQPEFSGQRHTQQRTA